MKLFSFRNFILGLFVSIGLFIGFGLFSFAADNGTVTISHTTGTAKSQYDGVTGYYSIYSSTAYANKYTKLTNITLNVKSSASVTFTQPLTVSLHLVTTDGDFVISGNKVASLTTSNVSIKGIGYPSSLDGCPVAYYIECSYVANANCTLTFSGSFDWEISDNGEEYWYRTIDGNVVDTLENTNTIISMLSDMGGSFYYCQGCSASSVANMSSTNLSNDYNNYFNYDFSYYIRILDTNFDYVYYYWTLNYFDGTTCNYGGYIKLLPTDNVSNMRGLSFSSDKRVKSIVFNVVVFGGNTEVVRIYKNSTGSTNPMGTETIIPRNSLNVYDTRESADWSTISNSQQLTDLNDTSGSIGTIISDNNVFESSAFTDFSDNLEEFGFDDWSLVPISSELNTTKNIITMFYNILPFKVQWLITSVMGLGLIVMLLTVGTRVVQRTGDFTRAKPVKMSYKSKGK